MAKNKFDEKKLDEVLTLTSKILRLFYYVLIVCIILIATFIIKEWGILRFLLTIIRVATPLFIGYVIAWLFSPIVKSLENRGVSRILGSIIVYSGFLFLLYLFFSALIPTFYRQLIDFLDVLPELLVSIENVITGLFARFNNGILNIDSIKQSIITTMQEYGNNMIKNLPDFLINSLAEIFSGLGTFALSIVLGFYILFDFERIKNFLISTVPNKFRYETSHFMKIVGIELRKTVNGTLLVASIIFVGTSIGFLLIGLKAPLLFGFLCGITDLIPYIGPLFGGFIAVIVGFSQSPLTGILALIVVIIVQQLENIVLQPLIMSRSTMLHPVIIILGLLIFGNFFGIIGMIIATPLLSFLRILFKFIVTKFDLFDYEEELFSK